MTTRAERNARQLETGHLMADLGGRTVRGGALAVGAQVVRMGLTLATYAVLARLLAPEDFGLVAMAGTVTAFVQLFKDLGLSTATIQRKELDQDTVSALFAMNVAMGVVIMLVAWAVAPLAALLFDDPRVITLVMAMALTMPVSAAGAQHRALLTRQMRWWTLHALEITTLLAGTVTAIVLAAGFGVGYWALVAQSWMSALIGVVLLWTLMPWRPARIASWAGGRSALRFGLNLTGFNLVNYFHRQADNVLIGWYWGATELGFYTRAYTLLMLPLTLINGPLSSATIPALSRLQFNDERWSSAFLRAFTAANLLGCASGAVLVAAAEPIIWVVYGEGWDRAAEVFLLLSFSIFAATSSNTAGWRFVSRGQPGRMLRWSLLTTTVRLISFAASLPYGITAFATVYTIVTFALLIPNLWYMSRDAPLLLSRLLRITLPCIAAGLTSALLTRHLVATGVTWTGDQPLIVMFLTAGLATCLYVITVAMLSFLLRDLRSTVFELGSLVLRLAPSFLRGRLLAQRV